MYGVIRDEGEIEILDPSRSRSRHMQSTVAQNCIARIEIYTAIEESRMRVSSVLSTYICMVD